MPHVNERLVRQRLTKAYRLRLHGLNCPGHGQRISLYPGFEKPGFADWRNYKKITGYCSMYTPDPGN